MNDNSGLWAVLLAMTMLIVMVSGMSNNATNKAWERMLVDNPQGIEAIRSRVLAERAEEAIVK